MRTTIFSSILMLCIACFGCFKKTNPPCDVVVSIPPYLYFVEKLMGDTIAATSLVPEGANPHLYEPSPKEIARARTAKVWIRLSEHFEKKILTAWQEENPKLISLNLAEKIDLPPLPDKKNSCRCCAHHKDQIDLHFWLSLRLAKQQAELIACTLIEAFPEKQVLIEENLVAFLKEMEDLDINITKQLAPFAGEAILVSHPAFAYFCYDYCLKQISIEQEGKDPLPKEISSLTELAKETHIQVVLTQAQYNNKGAELIANQLHLPIHEVDPYSANYLKNFLFIANCIQNP
jgi:zinc transport system substrate-binding protein